MTSLETEKQNIVLQSSTGTEKINKGRIGGAFSIFIQNRPFII